MEESALVSPLVSLGRLLVAVQVVLPASARIPGLSETSPYVVPCPMALVPCHAEGRGFESHHPLYGSPAQAGFSVGEATRPARPRPMVAQRTRGAPISHRPVRLRKRVSRQAQAEVLGFP